MSESKAAALLVGFDSAWTPGNSGAIVAALRREDGGVEELGPPCRVNFSEAEDCIVAWQAEFAPASTMVMLDQPTIVNNRTGQRPVENIVASAVSRRYGAIQPAYTAREEMFGPGAPLWRFLRRFGGPADPLRRLPGMCVFETYPVLTAIALGWTLPDARPAGRLPKYNPARAKTFSMADWRHVCERAAGAFAERGLAGTVRWLTEAAAIARPRKRDQDRLDACICLLAALHLAEGKPCLMVGDRETGYIAVPDCEKLRAELRARCVETNREPEVWVRAFRGQACDHTGIHS